MTRVTTRLLLTCAAIGVACAAVFIPVIWFGTAILATVPWLYGLIAGCYLLPGVIVQALFRRGGLAILTTTLGGLVAAAFVPGGVSYVPIFALVGLLQEIPFAISRYRYWATWVFFAAAGILGVGVGVMTFLPVAGAGIVGVAEILHSVAFVVGFAAFTALGLGLSAAVSRTGVTRGLALAVDRRAAVASVG